MYDDKVDQRESDAVNVPRQIGDYKILRVLGAGGMSIVYAALQKQPRRMVALKVMKQGTTTSTSLRRFRREIEILGRLHHPYIAQVFDAGMHDDGSGGVPYFVMEYVPSAKTVLEYVASNNLSMRDTLKLFVKICAAVEHGHHNKVVHRDLKPGNILIDRNLDPKVIDFGVARATEVDASSATMQTEAGRLIGTVQYMAPEQVDANPHDIKPSCDVYALGVLMYKLLTTRYPHSFEGLPIYEAVRVIRLEDPPKPSTINPEVRGDLETIMMRCLEKEPARRYQTAGQLGRDLLRYLGKVPIKARPAGLVYRLGLLARRRKSTFALITAMCAVVIIVAAVTTAIVLSLQPEPPFPAEVSNAGDASSTTTLTQPSNDSNQNPGGQDQSTASGGTSQATDIGPVHEPITLHNQDTTISALAFTGPTGLISQAGDHLTDWDLSTQTPTGWPIALRSPALMTMSSPEAQRLALTSGSKILIIDTEMGEVAHRISLDDRKVQALAISRDGSLVAYSLDDFTISVWSKERAKRKVLRLTSGEVLQLCFNADNSLLGGLSGREALIWRLEDEKLVFKMDGAEEPKAVTFVGERDLMAAVGSNGVLMMWDTHTGETLAPLSLMSAKLSALSIDPTGSMVICAEGKRVVVWSLPDRVMYKLGRLAEPPVSVAADPSSQTMALGFSDGSITVRPWPSPNANNAPQVPDSDG